MTPSPPSCTAGSISSTPPGVSSSRSASTSSASARFTRSASRIIPGAHGARCSSRGLVAQHSAQLGEHRLIRAQVVLGERPIQLSQQLTLLVGEAPWDHDVDYDAQVAAPATAQRGHSLTTHGEHLSRLSSRGHPNRSGGIERGDLERPPQGCKWGGNVERGDEVVTFAHEALVRTNADKHVEITGRSSPLARMTGSADANALTVGDTRGDRHLLAALDRLLPASPALFTRCAGEPSVTVAGVAETGAHHLTEAGARQP